MASGPFRTILIRASVLVVIGSAIGVVDAFVRPITLQRDLPPALDLSGSRSAKVAPALPSPAVPASGTPAAMPISSSDKPKAPTPAPVTPPAPVVAEAKPAPTLAAKPGACVPTAKDKLPPGHITMDEAKALFDQGTAVFVDTRKPDLYELGHVRGAFRIELHAFERGDPPALAMIARDSVVVTYCVGGNCDESEAVARLLGGSGYKKVYVMHDGFPCWNALGFPIDTGPGLFP